MAHQAGSAADLERLMEEYGTGLLRLCALQLGDAALAEDAAQETLLRAWRKYGTFRGEAAERTWITAIALNVCRDLLRSPWHTRRVELSALAEPAAEDAPWDDTPCAPCSPCPGSTGRWCCCATMRSLPWRRSRTPLGSRRAPCPHG